MEIGAMLLLEQPSDAVRTLPVWTSAPSHLQRYLINLHGTPICSPHADTLSLLLHYQRVPIQLFRDSYRKNLPTRLPELVLARNRAACGSLSQGLSQGFPAFRLVSVRAYQIFGVESTTSCLRREPGLGNPAPHPPHP